MFFPNGSRRLQGFLMVFEAVLLVSRGGVHEPGLNCIFLILFCFAAGGGFRGVSQTIFGRTGTRASANRSAQRWPGEM